MSLEEAVNRNNELLEKHNALLERMLAGAKAPASDKAADKPTDKPAAKAADKPAAKAADKPASKTQKGALTVEDVAGKATAFLKIADKDERKARIAYVGQIVSHYGVEKLTMLDVSDFEAALKMIDDYEAGEPHQFGDADEEEEESLV